MRNETADSCVRLRLSTRREKLERRYIGDALKDDVVLRLSTDGAAYEHAGHLSTVAFNTSSTSLSV